MNYIKLKKENPKWKNEKIAQCLNLPEVKINKKLPKPSFNRQKVIYFLNEFAVVLQGVGCSGARSID